MMSDIGKSGARSSGPRGLLLLLREVVAPELVRGPSSSVTIGCRPAPGRHDCSLLPIPHPVTHKIPFTLREEEIEFSAIRAQGAGGQNVNKVSNAIQLRFDVRASTLPDPIKAKLLVLRDQRVTTEGVIVIKAQQFRSLERNRADALARLHELVAAAAIVPRVRRATKPTRSSQRKRVESKLRRGQVKAQRGRVDD